MLLGKNEEKRFAIAQCFEFLYLISYKTVLYTFRMKA